MSAAITTVYAYLDFVDPALGQEARTVYKTARSIKAVYALAGAQSPQVEQIARRVYASACKVIHQRDKQRLDMQVARMRAGNRKALCLP